MASKANGKFTKKGSKRKNEGGSLSQNPSGKNARSNSGGTRVKTTYFSKGGNVDNTKERAAEDMKSRAKGRAMSGKFGRVMSKLPTLGMPRVDTVSIAVPTSVITNAQTKELKAMLIGQIARAATIYCIDEVIIYEDQHQLTNQSKADTSSNFKNNPLQFMQRLLEYAETPPYLKRSLFSNHADLQVSGMLPPTDAPHHVRRGEQNTFREGCTLENDEDRKDSTSTLCNCGVEIPVEIPIALPAGIRVTVQIDNYNSVKSTTRPGTTVIMGTAVASSKPREIDGTYWGYTVRGVSGGLKGVFEDGPFEGGYDYKIGTSERGTDLPTVLQEGGGKFPKQYKHGLVVFGGVHGIEQCVADDEDFPHVNDVAKDLFDCMVNTVPIQGSRTVRTEEAVLLSLAQMRSAFIANTKAANGIVATDSPKSASAETVTSKVEAPKREEIVFSDVDVSDESDSDGENSN